jgi:hypothetical protein
MGRAYKRNGRVHKGFNRKIGTKESMRRPRRRWRIISKLILDGMHGVDGSHLARDLVETVINLLVP